MASITAVLTMLAALTSLGCMVLLLRAYLSIRLRLLMWSTLCFVCLSISNILLFLDLVVFPDIDFRPYRLVAAFAGVVFLLYGFIWEAE